MEEENNPQDAAQNVNTDSSGGDPEITGENISSAEPVTEDEHLSTINYQPSTSSMETHAQHLHKAPGHGWKHYFFEFFMLFLAVFCGFLAENWREHYVERKKEKQYVQSLVNDLRLDMAWLDTVNKSATMRIENLDSAIVYLSANHTEIPVSAYQRMRSSTVQVMFFPNDGTIAQLKNSGGMRLIAKRATVDSIEQYDRQIRRLEVRRDITNQITRDFTEALNRTVSGNDLVAALYDSSFYKKSIEYNNPIKLIEQSRNELINQSISLRLRAVQDINTNVSVKRIAFSLVEFLKKEYYLE